MVAGLKNNSGFIAFFRDAAWLTRDRVIAYSRLMILLQAIALIVLALHLHGFFGGPSDPISIDFLSLEADPK
jgi:hypothetical protein